MRLRNFCSTLVLCLCVALAPTITYAVDLPSELSGTYEARPDTPLDGWTCDLSARQISAGVFTNRVLSAECDSTDGGVYGGAVSTANPCPSSAVTRPPLLRFGSGPLLPTTPRLIVHEYRSSTKRCSLGEVTVSTGGPATVMCRTQIVLPAVGYPGCGAGSGSISRRG